MVRRSSARLAVGLGLTAGASMDEDLVERGVPRMTGPGITAALSDKTLVQTGDAWVWHGHLRADGRMPGTTGRSPQGRMRIDGEGNTRNL